MKLAAMLCAAFPVLFAPAVAQAHAHLDHAVPAVGGTVAQAPKEVTIFFTQALEARFSTIVVRDSRGTAVQAGAAKLAPDNTAQLSVALKPLAPGSYKVIWRVLSVDTHRSQGEFTFRVGP
jgi:methionine-rich copper-binding protein CopC